MSRVVDCVAALIVGIEIVGEPRDPSRRACTSADSLLLLADGTSSPSCLSTSRGGPIMLTIVAARLSISSFSWTRRRATFS